MRHAFFLFAAGFVFAACSSWSSVHHEAATMLAEVGACNAGDACVVVAGVEGDCSGLLGCPFPARADRADEARSRSVDIAHRSRGFNECATGFCDGPASALVSTCDVASHRCSIPALPPPDDDAGTFDATFE